MTNRNKIGSYNRLLGLLVLVLFICLEANGQILQMPTMGGFSKGGGKSSSNTPPMRETMAAPVEPREEEPDSVKKRNADLASSEADLRRLEIQKERILLERELETLKAQGLSTKQDTINMDIKKRNLQLLYLKEQLLLKEELKQMGGLRDYGASAVYGHHFFREGGIRFFQKASDAAPSGSYVLGRGDKLHIEVWGYSALSADLEVDEQGYANLPYGQKVYLSGISLDNANKIIKSKLNSMVDLRNSSLSISVLKYRTITVNIVGEVFKPGSYVIPAINTAFNALTVMGGPTNIGSVRNIYIKRNGAIVDSLDAYDYMLNPKKSREVYLQDNDYIIVEPLGSVVSISGAVRRAGSFELKPGEKLSKLINLAADLTPTSYLEDVLVTRVRDNKFYEQISINYDSLLKIKKDFELFNGDAVEFKSINEDQNKLLTISGSVNIPGTYKVSKNSTIKELVAQANGLLKEAYMEEAFIIRTNEDYTKTFLSFNLNDAMNGGPNAIDVQPYDEIFVFSIKSYLLNGNLTIKGAVKRPQSMVYAENMSLRDLIYISGGLLPESYLERGVLTRTNITTGEKQTIVFNVDEVNNNSGSNANLKLERNDEVEIFSKIKFREKFSINIDGEVHNPGVVDFSTNMTLKDLIFKSGGLKTSAINSKIEIVRSFKFGEDMIQLEPIPAEIIVMEIGAVLELDPMFENFILYPFDQVSIRKNPYYLESRKVLLTGAVMYPGEYTLLSEDEKLSSLIERAGGLRSYAFPEGLEFKRISGVEEGSTDIITNLKRALKNPNSSYNYILLEGDNINIPIANELVSISGNIMNEDKDRLSIFYKKHRRAKHYINRYAGGFKERSMKRKTYVKYADGTAKRTKNFVIFKVYPKPKPGSEIFVIKNPKVRKRLSLGGGIEETTTKITAVMTLILMYAVIQQTFK